MGEVESTMVASGRGVPEPSGGAVKRSESTDSLDNKIGVMSGAFASPSKSANDLASIAGSIGDNGTTADKSKSSPAPENQDGWNQSLGDSVPTVVTTAVSKMMPTRMAPWGEFLSRSALKLPQISEIPGRLRENRQFGGNYAVSTGVLLSLWVITHPMTLFVVVALAGTWTYALRRKDPVVVGGTELTERRLYLALRGGDGHLGSGDPHHRTLHSTAPLLGACSDACVGGGGAVHRAAHHSARPGAGLHGYRTGAERHQFPHEQGAVRGAGRCQRQAAVPAINRCAAHFC